MHVPDGFLDGHTSIATGVVAAVGVGIALRGARNELDDRTAPMAGLVGAFVFATQMVNYPVGAGTSGHLMGGALAAALVGPWTGILVISAVLLVQAVLFADGGLTAIGTNITLMGLVGVLGAWLIIKGLMRILPKRTGSVPIAAGIGALLSVPLSAVVFVGLFAVGGVAAVPVGEVLAAMAGWHLVVGIGEALITALVVAVVVSARPDLVYAARGIAAEPQRQTEVTA